MPSASVMTRESRTPVFVWSKKPTWRRPTWRWTLRRISVIERCAAFAEHLGQGVTGDGLDRGWRLRPRGRSAGRSCVPPLSDDVVEKELGRARQDQARQLGEEEKPETEGEAPLSSVKKLGRVPQNDREGEALLFRRLFVGPGGRPAPFGLGGSRREPACRQTQPCHALSSLLRCETILWAGAPRRGGHWPAERNSPSPRKPVQNRILTGFVVSTDNIVNGNEGRELRLRSCDGRRARSARRSCYIHSGSRSCPSRGNRPRPPIWLAGSTCRGNGSTIT